MKRSQQAIETIDGVTRFGEILPLKQNFKRLWQKINCSLSFWQNLNILWQTICSCYWANFQCCKCPNVLKEILPSCHTAVVGRASVDLNTSPSLSCAVCIISTPLIHPPAVIQLVSVWLVNQLEEHNRLCHICCSDELQPKLVWYRA